MKHVLKKIIFILLCGFLSCATNNSQTTTTENIDLPFEKFTLPNGLDVIFHVDKSLPMVHVNTWYHVGSKNDPQNIKGFAHLFEHMMFQGTLHAPRDYFDYFSEIGATETNASTNSDRTDYFNTIPSEKLETLLWLEADRMGFMTEQLDETQFANQKDVVRNEARERSNKPYFELSELMTYIYPEGHPYKHRPIGDQQQLAKASLEDVKDFYSLYYTPNNATLTIAGNFSPDQARIWIEKYFGPLKPGPKFNRALEWIPSLETTREFSVEKNIPLAAVNWIWPAPKQYSSDSVSLDFAAAILGGDESSRLYKSLVHEKQLASEVYVENTSLEISGLFSIVVILSPDAKLSDVEATIQDELQKFAKDGPTTEELERIRAGIEYSFVTSLETLSGKASQLNAFNTYLNDPGYINTFYQQYQNVTGKNVQDVFKKWVFDKPLLKIKALPQNPKIAAEDSVNRKERPVDSTPQAFTPPTIEKAVLKNGLEIYVSQRNELPKVLVSFNIKQGNILESKEKAGTAYLTAGLIERGTNDLPFLALKEKIAKQGASISSHGDKYGSEVFLSVLKKHLSETFSILSDAVQHPSFAEDEITRLKKITIDDIGVKMKNPKSLANLVFNEKLFGDHPYGIDESGTKDSISSISRDDILREYKTFWHAGNAHITFVGDISLAEAKSLAEKYFGDWTKKENPKLTINEPLPQTKTRIFVVDFPNTTQSSIRFGLIGIKRDNPDYYALNITTSILGGGMSARLFKNLREAKGYTYGAYTDLFSGLLSGYIKIYTDVQTDKTYESLVEIKNEILALKTNRPIIETEAVAQKQLIVSSFMSDFGSNFDILEKINSVINYNLDFKIFAEYPSLIDKQNISDLQNAAQKYFPNEGATIVVVGDMKKIKPSLEKIDWADVTYLQQNGEVFP